MKGKTAAGMDMDALSLFFWQISLMLESGLAVRDGMDGIIESFDRHGCREALERMRDAMDMGESMYDAMCAAGIFPAYALKMIQVGERAGQLEEISRSLSEYYSRQSQIMSAIRSATRYPLMLLGVIAVVVIVMVAGAMPVFNRVYESLGMNISAMTKSLMQVGRWFGYGVLILVAAIFALAAVCVIANRRGHRDGILRVAKKLLPVIDGIQKSTAAWRFSSVYSMLMNVGYPAGEALEMTADALETAAGAQEAAQAAREAAQSGEDPAKAIENTGLFDALTLHMIHAGFNVGRSDTAIAKVADIYHDRTEEQIYHALSMIEPALVGILAGIIGCIMLSVVLPLAAILTSFI